MKSISSLKWLFVLVGSSTWSRAWLLVSQLFLYSSCLSDCTVLAVEFPEATLQSTSNDDSQVNEEYSKLFQRRQSGIPLLFDEKTIRYSGGGYVDQEFSYRLFVPAFTTPAENLPMLVWLHGAGERGNDNVSQLRWLQGLIFKRPYQKNDYPFFLLALQCPEDNSSWTGGDTNQDAMANVVVAAIEETLKQYPVDRNRVSLAGISSGGHGCWYMAAHHSGQFSAIAPMSSASAESPEVSTPLPPIWAFASAQDQKVPLQSVEQTCQRFRDAGAFVKMTDVNLEEETDLWEHDSWTPAFTDYQLLVWLLSQDKGNAAGIHHWNWYRHRYVNWPFLWPRLLPLSIVVLLGAAIRREVHRRRSTCVPVTISRQPE